MSNNLNETIVDILTPYLGKAMSESSVKVNCTVYLHIPPEKISKEHIPALCDRLIRGLKVFVGDDKAEQIVGTIQKLK
jgi:hypothetical protein